MRQNKKQEHGNVFLFVLLGVALFSALAFTISRGMRSTTTTNLSNRETELAAADIVSYAQKMERAVARLRRKSVSENDISFANDFVSGYAHTPAQADSNKVFHISGGTVTWQDPASGVNNGDDWHFTGATCIADIGTGATGCDGDTVSNEELIAVLPNLTQSLCSKINEKLGISGIPTDSGGGYSATKFTGSFADGTEIILGSSYNTACFSNSGYHFYSVLLER